MAEPGGGVYRSSIDPGDWVADEEVGGQAHMLFDLGDTKAGLWRSGPDGPPAPAEVPIPSRETIVVLEGGVVVRVDGTPHDLGTGDMLSIPAGATVGWDPSHDCKVFWVYS
jgi:uncharacterized cupin superfamily protein